MSDSGDEDVPKLGDKRVIIGRRKKMKGLRKSGDWTGERELTFIYKDARKATLAQLAVDYADGRLTYPDLLEQVPLETNWLRASENQKRRCAGRKTLLVLGWCPIRDGKINLDADPRKACFTEQWIMALERLLGEPVLMIDFFHVRINQLLVQAVIVV